MTTLTAPAASRADAAAPATGYWDLRACRWVGDAPASSTHLVPAGRLRSVELSGNPRLPAQRTGS
jgi:hypothetical protein